MNCFAILLSVICLSSLAQFSLEEKSNRWRTSYKLKDSRRNRRRGRGKKGRPGPVGPPGNPGPPGLPGRDGQPGSPGIPGEAGLRGNVGLPGNRGLKGQQGERGDKGDRGTPGSPGQACFLEKTDVQICMTPPSGPEGPQGVKGDPGSVGQKGDPGVPGKNGSPGERGLRGPPGRAVDAINIRCHTRHNKLMVPKEQIAENLEDLINAHCDPLQFLQGMKIYKDTTSIKLVYTCCSFY